MNEEDMIREMEGYDYYLVAKDTDKIVISKKHIDIELDVFCGHCILEGYEFIEIYPSLENYLRLPQEIRFIICCTDDLHEEESFLFLHRGAKYIFGRGSRLLIFLEM